MIQLTATDGHELGAYIAKPTGTPKGAVVVVQEIFGVNPSIRTVVDQLAAAGYVAIAPALFDRFKKDIELGYTGVDQVEAFALYQLLTVDKALKDVGAAFAEAKKYAKDVAVMGFCFGGLMTWTSATRGSEVGMAPACCAAYYPGGVGKVADQTLSCPVIVHVGTKDSHVGQDQVEAVKAAHPEVPVYLYADCEHGFANLHRAEYNESAAGVAWDRTLALLSVSI